MSCYILFEMSKEIKSRRQKPISVTSKEHKALWDQKRRYQDKTGDSGDWGKFLETISLLGLAALGIYGLAKATERTEKSAKVKCPNCNQIFPMALADEQATIVQVPCPWCDTNLVVNLGASSVYVGTSQTPFADWSGRCPACGEVERIVFVDRPPYRGEQVEVACRQCGNTFIIRQLVQETGINDREV